MRAKLRQGRPSLLSRSYSRLTRARPNGVPAMAKVVFTPNVQRHVACPEAEAPRVHGARSARQYLCRQPPGAGLRAGRPIGAAQAHDDLRGRADDPRPSPPRRSRARVRAASTCSRRCQEADSMSDKLLVSPARASSRSRVGPRGIGRLRTSISLVTMSPSRSPTLATGAPMPRSTTGILASNYTARRRAAGRRFPAPRISAQARGL